MFDYQTKGYSQFGASMGRRSDLDKDATAALMLRHVALDEGGYDPGGAYWGTPHNLYCATDPESGEVSYVRARSMTAARVNFPNATWVDGTLHDGSVSDEDKAEFLQAYITAALWSSNDESDDQGGDPMDCNYSADDLASETLATMTVDCDKFLTANAADIDGNVSHAGHDFWLTRCGHGVGFEDRDYYIDRDRLANAARAFGEVNLYVGDDGKIYQ